MTNIHRNGALPRLPVLGWAAYRGPRHAAIPSVTDGGSVVYTTSGRAAIALALQVLEFKPGQRVLVPTYHCPTMILPVVRLGGEPVFFPITATGAPDLDALAMADLRGVRAMLVAHYFGLPQPLARVRSFCDSRGIALIEDCAHAFFGTSEGRPVGAWGDVAIASLTKFFPVAEGGCLVSHSRELTGIALAPRSALDEVRSLADALELGARHRRFAGVNTVMRGAFGLKELARGRPWQPVIADEEEPAAGAVDPYCDALVASRLTRAARVIASTTARHRIVTLRQRNYRLLSRLLGDLPAAHPYQPGLSDEAAPYVFPLHVERPVDRYRALRAARVPLFRWDRVWPGTPTLPADAGLAWAVQVFQFACHQDLSEDDVRQIAGTVQQVFARVP